LNGSGRNGGAYGFRLTTLAKFESTRRNGVSLLQFACKLFRSQGIKIVDEVLEDLELVSKALNVDITSVSDVLTAYTKSLASLKSDLKEYKEDSPTDEWFCKQLGEFQEDALARVNKTKDNLAECIKNIELLARKYKEKGDVDVQKFFKIFDDFRQDIEKTMEKIKKEEESLELERRRTLRKKNRRKSSKKPNKQTKRMSSTPSSSRGNRRHNLKPRTRGLPSKSGKAQKNNKLLTTNSKPVTRSKSAVLPTTKTKAMQQDEELKLSLQFNNETKVVAIRSSATLLKLESMARSIFQDIPSNFIMTYMGTKLVDLELTIANSGLESGSELWIEAVNERRTSLTDRVFHEMSDKDAVFHKMNQRHSNRRHHSRKFKGLLRRIRE